MATCLDQHFHGGSRLREEVIVDLSLEHLEFSHDLVASTGGDILAKRSTIGSVTHPNGPDPSTIGFPLVDRTFVVCSSFRHRDPFSALPEHRLPQRSHSTGKFSERHSRHS